MFMESDLDERVRSGIAATHAHTRCTLTKNHLNVIDQRFHFSQQRTQKEAYRFGKVRSRHQQNHYCHPRGVKWRSIQFFC
jgi:hypothetical protein